MQKFLRILLIFIGTYLLTVYWNINQHAIHALNEITLYSTSSIEGKINFVTVADILKFLFIILFSLWILKHLPNIYDFILVTRLKTDYGLRYALLTITRYIILLLGLLIGLSIIHVDLDKIGWLVAAFSVGIGFGLQEIFANFVSGIILLVERPIRIGDRISVGNISGDVKKINIRATTVLNFEMQEILVPNRDLITKEVTNWTLENSIIRLIINIGVAYGSDINKVKSILYGIAKNQPEILETPETEVFFMNHNDSSLDFELRVFIPNPGLKLIIKDRINTLINQEFKTNNIEIPFPQQDIHIKKSLS